MRVVIGIGGAIGLILYAFWIDNGQITLLFNLPAFLIVIGGTIAATIIQANLSVWLKGMSTLQWVLHSPNYPFLETITHIKKWNLSVRKSGVLSIEKESNVQSDLFLRKGLQLLVDGHDSDQIKEQLQIDLETQEQHGLQGAMLFESMAGYAPTLGILGAVLGLIQVMSHLDNTELLGAGIATAFVATVYGVGLANLLLLPISGRIRDVVAEQFRYRSMIIAGLCAIADGVNSQVIERKIQGYL